MDTTPAKDIDWDMFTAESVRPIETAFPVIGDFHGASSVAFFGYDNMKRVFKDDYKLYKDKYRDAAKRSGLALLYGGSHRVIAAPSEAEQKKLFTNFFSTLKGFKKHLQEIESRARKQLYTHNIFGFRVWLKDINHRDFKVASAVKRKMLNFPIQSVGAQSLLFAMHRIMRFTQKTHTNRFTHDNIHNDYYNRIVLAPTEYESRQDFLDALEALPSGNIALCIGSPNNITHKWDRHLAIDQAFIAHWGLTLYF